MTNNLNSLKKNREKARKYLENNKEERSLVRFNKGGKVSIFKYSGSTLDGSYKQLYVPLHSEHATRIVNSQYCKELIKRLDVEIEALDIFLKTFHPEAKFNVDKKFRKKFGERIIPIVINPEDFARNWGKQEYKQFDGFPEGKKILTIKGDLVRSKSEAAIADYLYNMGIPYRYEPEIIKNGRAYYPDFVICSPYDGQFYVIEHFGQFDDVEYCKRNVRKIQEYSKSEKFNNQIWFFETKEDQLDMRIVENVIFQKLNLEMYGVKRIYS